ncbi:MAG TPA: hypothetical protein VNI34_07430 [Candidatus Nitrosotalea sp.]|nr:hypothetical protein [Candidatus Nitrosotalea sp.]
MPATDTTRPAPVLEGYNPPEQEARRERMAAQMRKLPRYVDHNGRTIRGPDPTTVEAVTPTAIRPMAVVLAEVAAACGASVTELVENDEFTAEILKTSPADIEGLTAIVRAFAPAPAMKVNLTQGHASSASVPAAPRNLLERLQLETEKALDQPLPPGSTTL